MTTRLYSLIFVLFLAFVCVSSGLSPNAAMAHSSNSILFSDIFSDGNMNDWAIVDAPGATNAPSAWSVVLDLHNYMVRQRSNIYTPQEGTYAYVGDSTWSNYHFETDVLPQDNDSFFVLFRYVDNDNRLVPN